MSTEIGTITINLSENAAATFKLLLEAVKLTRPVEKCDEKAEIATEKCDEVVAEYAGPSEEPYEEIPTPVVEESRNYTMLEVGKAGAWLMNHKKIDSAWIAENLGGKAIQSLDQAGLNDLAAKFIALGAVI